MKKAYRQLKKLGFKSHSHTDMPVFWSNQDTATLALLKPKGLTAMAKNKQVQEIDLKDIEQNENSRVVYKEVDLHELMQSMKQDGLLQPIGVMPTKKGKYECVFGNRRVVAAKKLGWTSIPASVMTEIDDDSHRDILGIIENKKRQNTSIAEDARIYQVLLDRGLKIPELAVRLGTTEHAIQLALDVVKHVPLELRSKVVNRISGGKQRGTISASSTHAILNLRKKQGLNRKQTRAILNYAATDGASFQHINKIAPLVKRGFTVENAIKRVSGMERIAIEVFIPTKVVEALEAKHQESIGMILKHRLEGIAEYKIQLLDSIPNRAWAPASGKTRTILRKAANG